MYEVQGPDGYLTIDLSAKGKPSPSLGTREDREHYYIPEEPYSAIEERCKSSEGRQQKIPGDYLLWGFNYLYCDIRADRRIVLYPRNTADKKTDAKKSGWF